MEDDLKIGDVAAAAGVKVQTLRYYEDRGLIYPPRRTEGGFRLYVSDAVGRVRFIKKAQALGFTLDEILDLLSLDGATGTTCRQMRERVTRKLDDVDMKIRQLRKLRCSLAALADRCPGDEQPKRDCPIRRSLAEEED